MSELVKNTLATIGSPFGIGATATAVGLAGGTVFYFFEDGVGMFFSRNKWAKYVLAVSGGIGFAGLTAGLLLRATSS